jgi:hypothetical protein
MSSSSRRAKILSVVRGSSGNGLEVYDFFVFGYDASAIGKTFLPVSSGFASAAPAQAAGEPGSDVRAGLASPFALRRIGGLSAVREETRR